MDLHRPGVSLHNNAFAGQLVETAAAGLEGGDHRRHLMDPSQESGNDAFEIGRLNFHRLPIEHRAVSIQGVGGHAKLGYRLILLGLILDESDQSRYLAQGQNHCAGCHRIERPGVTDLSHTCCLLHLVDHMGRRDVGRLVDNQKPFAHRCSPTLETTWAITSSGSPTMVNPAARRWPPPPNDAARDPTSVAPRERRLTLTFPSE